MRVVVQRVSSASVHVAGDLIAAIEEGMLVLVGIVDGDGPEDVETMAEKVAHLRIFPDGAGRMNRSVVDHGGAALVVSQFTLAADVRRGRRPSFTTAAEPDRAAPMVESFADHLRAHGIATATGVFGAMMDVALVNAGPVTIVIDVEDGGFV